MTGQPVVAVLWDADELVGPAILAPARDLDVHVDVAVQAVIIAQQVPRPRGGAEEEELREAVHPGQVLILLHHCAAG